MASGELAAGAGDGAADAAAVGCDSGDGAAIGGAALVDASPPAAGDAGVELVIVGLAAAAVAPVDCAAPCAPVCVAAAPCTAGCAGADPAGVAASFVVPDCGAEVCCPGAGVELGCAAGVEFDWAGAGAGFGCLINDGGGSGGASGGVAFCEGAACAWQGCSTNSTENATAALHARTPHQRANRR